MATVLGNYEQDKQALIQRMDQEQITADILWRYGELVYRIGVLETCKVFCRSAPICREMQPLQRHYLMLDAYIQSMASERNYGPSRGPDTEKERQAAKTNLARVIQDYRQRFSSFVPATDSAYSVEVSRLIKAIMPAWLQFRDTFIPLSKEEKGHNGK